MLTRSAAFEPVFDSGGVRSRRRAISGERLRVTGEFGHSTTRSPPWTEGGVAANVGLGADAMITTHIHA